MPHLTSVIFVILLSFFLLNLSIFILHQVILPFFGGYLVDRVGVRMCLLLFASLIAIGQVIFSIGLSIKSWPVMFVGRLVFGFGGESFTVANSALLAQWFKGKELAFAFGVNLSISKLGSVINNIVSPMLSDDVSILFALWFGAILCAACVGCVLITIPLDIAIDRQVQRNIEDQRDGGPKIVRVDRVDIGGGDSDDKSLKEASTVNVLHTDAQHLSEHNSTHDGSLLSSTDNQEVGLRDVLKFKNVFWILVISCMVVYGCVLPFNNISSSLLLERDYFQEPSSSCTITNPNQCESTENPYKGCSSSKHYQPPLPTTAIVDGVTYDPLNASDIDCNDDNWKNNCATSLYCSRLTDAESEASVIMSIPYIISACLSPPLGFAVDIYGLRAFIAAVAPMILIIVHSCLALTKSNPVGPLVGQGLAYTGFVSVLWPAIPLVVQERETGLAFGVVTSVQNLACALVPLLAAAIYSDSNDKYIPNVELLFVALASIGFMVGLYMNYYDWNHDHVLNGPYWKKMCYRLCGMVEYEKLSMNGDDNNTNAKALLTPLRDQGDEEEDGDGVEAHSSFDGVLDEEAARNVWTTRPSPAPTSENRHRSRSRTSSRGGSFTSYEEAMRAGAFRTKAAGGTT